MPPAPSSRSTWLALAVVAAVVLLGVAWSVSVAAWLLAGLAAAAAVLRVAAPARAPILVRHRAVDAAMLVAFAGAFAFIAATTALG